MDDGAKARDDGAKARDDGEDNKLTEVKTKGISDMILSYTSSTREFVE